MQICLNGRSCAAVDAGNSPCHDVTIQNPQIALVNIKSVVLQLRQPGGALLSFSPMNCTLYASSTPGGVGNAMVRESHVMLNASCVHTRILWPGMRVLSAPSCQRPLRPFIRRRWAPSPSRQSLYLALPREVKFARYAKRAHPCLSLFVPNKIRQFFRTSLSHKGSSKVVFSPRACIRS